MQEIDRAQHARGFALTLFGVLVLTPDTLLIRLIDTDPWTMTFWRGVLMAPPLLIAYWLAYRDRALADIRMLGLAGLVVSLIYGINAVTFVLAIDYTKVANVLVILAATPLFAALMSIVFLHERVHLPTWLAIFAAIAGVVIVVAGGLTAGTWTGDIYALITAIALAASFTIMRHMKASNMVPATALGGVFAALFALPFADPMGLEGNQVGLMLFLGLVIMPVSFGLITLGPRTVPAPEVALLLLVETVLGPLWVWLVINETPSLQTLIGGAVVIASVALHALWRLTRRRRV